MDTAIPGESGEMTVETCTTGYRAGDYVLAGLEYAGEGCKFLYILSLPDDAC